MTADPATGPWHLDKRIPVMQILAIWGAITVQTFAFGWLTGSYQASTDERLKTLEGDRAERTTLVNIWQNERRETADRLARLETEVKGVKEVLLRIETKLTRQEEGQ